MVIIVSDFMVSTLTPYHSGQTSSRPHRWAIEHPLEGKPFVSWDGEGITPPKAHQQDYVMLGTSARATPLRNHFGIPTLDALAYIIQVERENPDAIHVAFAFSYDTEMILKDIPPGRMRRLYKTGVIKWEGYRIEYRRGKWLQITQSALTVSGSIPTEESGETVTDGLLRSGIRGKVTCRIWDVWSFFSCPFIDAVKDYCPDTSPEVISRITSGKLSRGSFTIADLPEMAEYMAEELRLLVEMMDVLRGRLYGAGLRITHWQGPGALASFSLKEHDTERFMTRDHSDEMLKAFMYAYAAGRFELFQMGHYHGTVHQYDIRSAYPNAIRHLPNLNGSSWARWQGERIRSNDFSIFRIRFIHGRLLTSLPMPYFYRDEKHAIHFPNHVEGWYWAPEAAMAQGMPGAEILEGWVLRHDGSKPFAWVEDVYSERAAMKKAGNASQLAYKLLLNSIYGKTAQRVGWEKYDGPPKWHQLEWAGWITSYTRAMLYGAMLSAHNQGGLLGVETDGIYSTVPLDLPIGEKLGEWEHTSCDEMIYLQSGFYFRKIDGSWYVKDSDGMDTEKENAKYRGFDRGSITIEQTISALSRWRPWEDSDAEIVGTTTRFLTMGTYLRMHNPEMWRRVWATELRTVKLGRDGKRIHVASLCPMCAKEISPADSPHPLYVSRPPGGHSRPHSIPWLGGERNPFREQATDLTNVSV